METWPTMKPLMSHSWSENVFAVTEFKNELMLFSFFFFSCQKLVFVHIWGPVWRRLMTAYVDVSLQLHEAQWETFARCPEVAAYQQRAGSLVMNMLVLCCLISLQKKVCFTSPTALVRAGCFPPSWSRGKIRVHSSLAKQTVRKLRPSPLVSMEVNMCHQDLKSRNL